MAVKHIGFIAGGSRAFAQTAGLSVEEAYERRYANVLRTIEACCAKGIPTMTFLLLPYEIHNHRQYPVVVDSLVRFIDALLVWPAVREQRIRIAVLGHWYDMPGRAVEAIKRVLDATAGNDGRLVNLCLNYDGRQEIVDATRLLAHQVRLGKIDPDAISAERIKESVYTASLAPPDLIVKTGTSRRLGSFLLWDSHEADVHITGRPWQEFSTEELDALLAGR